ncbi:MULTISPECIES: glycosyltransferase 87 family protein [unclassified Haloarcula]|uniref:glycosyltransferase 87 family protein n=1 Tax=unclassified Haloarcula TaxID=2624677 RepID=UPI000EF18357|nr:MULTISPECIES: glycosyltransferase 87 family protein [unclassified Haloarcula]RLM32796.1 DUF2029 domain-containing protein [Haloarcula sp. Atlit-120R]RLM41256.1 DUF2029 domain-containing protein [Haloarcula sp. Atlit-47R]
MDGENKLLDSVGRGLTRFTDRLSVDNLSAFDVAVGTYALAMILGGSFFYGDTDVGAFLSAAGAVTSGTPVYSLPHSAYAPLPYVLFAVVLSPIQLLGHLITPPNYLSIFALKTLFVGALVTIVYLPTDIDRRHWALLVLGTPITIYYTGFFGQSDALVALAVVSMLVAVHNERWALAGASAAVATSLKIYPAIAALVLLIRYRSHYREIILGALPITCLTAGLLFWMAPESITAALDTSHPFLFKDRPITTFSAQSLVSYFIGESTTLGLQLFPVTTVAAAIWAIRGEFTVPELALVIPMIPAVLVYPYAPIYRWLPVLLGLGYCAAIGPDRLRTHVAIIAGTLSIRPLAYLALMPVYKMPNFIGQDTRLSEGAAQPILTHWSWTLITVVLLISVLSMLYTASGSQTNLRELWAETLQDRRGERR